MEKDKKFKIGLISKLLIGVIVGVTMGSFCPAEICRVVITLSSLFSSYLKFIIPLMIFAFVTKGIADLSQGAGKLLGVTVLMAYGSTFLAGGLAYLTSSTLFPYFISSYDASKITTTKSIDLEPYFSFAIPPIIDTVSAMILSFILGIYLSSSTSKHDSVLYRGVKQLSEFITTILNKTIIPFLYLYTCGTFVDMTYSGRTFVILGIIWKVYPIVILLQWIYIIFQFFIASVVSKKNFFTMLKCQIPGYTTALGTQSSAAAIPASLLCAKNMGISSEIRHFVVPLCSNIHICGSMITITCCAILTLLINGLHYSFVNIFLFMIAISGVPVGGMMAALPFLPMIGLNDSSHQSLMITLYIAYSGFIAACNASGDNAIGVILDKIFSKSINKNKNLKI